MRILPFAAAALALSACQPAPSGSGDPFFSAIGTPFLIAFKIPVCAATIAIAAPLAGVSELSSPAGPDGHDARLQLAHGRPQPARQDGIPLRHADPGSRAGSLSPPVRSR